MYNIDNCICTEQIHNGVIYAVAIVPNEGYIIKFKQGTEYVYSDSIQTPISDFNNVVRDIEIIMVDEIPENVISESASGDDEIDFEQAYHELTEVLDDD